MTAVEYLSEQIRLTNIEGLRLKLWDAIEKAKEMEKEQHQETFKQSRSANIFKENMTPTWGSFEQYYKETFKSE